MKWVKRLVLALAALILVFIGLVVLLVVTVDPNDYKQLIVEQVNKTTGRQLSLEGDISLSFFPWLGLRLGEAELSNAAGFGETPFARVEEVQVRVSVLPLLKREVRADTLKFSGLSVDLRKNREGVSNWDDLIPETTEASQTPPPAAPETASMPVAWVVGGIEISDAAVRWQDAQSGTDVRISPFNLTTGVVQLDHPIALNMDLVLHNQEPQIKAAVTLQTQATVDLNTQIYRLGDLQFAVHAEGDALPNGEWKMTLDSTLVADMNAQTLTADPLALQAVSVTLDGRLQVERLLGDPKVVGHLKSAPIAVRDLLAALGQPPLQTTDPDVLKQAKLDLDFEAGSDRAAIPRLEFVLDESRLNGEAELQSFARPKVRFKLRLDQLDVDRYLPPTAEQTPTEKRPQPAPSGTPAAPQDDQLALPMDTLRGLTLDGRLEVAKLKLAELRLSDIQATLVANDGLLSVKPLNSKVYGGQLTSHFSLDARQDTPLFAFFTNLEGVRLGDLIQDVQQDKAYLRGRGTLSYELKTRGERVSTLKQQLGGKLNLAVTQGALRDPELARKVEAVVAFLKNRKPNPPGEELIFDSLTGSAVVTNGVLQNDDLKLITPLILAKGQGSANLVNETADYTLSVGLAGDETKKERIFVPITMQGPFAKLKYGLDLKKVAKQRLQKEVDKHKEKAQEKLDAELQKREGDLKEELKKKLGDKLKLF